MLDVIALRRVKLKQRRPTGPARRPQTELPGPKTQQDAEVTTKQQSKSQRDAGFPGIVMQGT